MSLEDYKKAVLREIPNLNTGEMRKTYLQNEVEREDGWLQIYYGDSLTPQETAQALLMGY